MTDIAEIIAQAILPRVHEMYDAEIAAEAVVAALQERGFVVVPVVPTEEMRSSGDRRTYATDHFNVSDVWSAMLAASPGLERKKTPLPS